MKVTPLDLRQQRFKTVMRGYDRGEVQAFLLEVADDYENALRENDKLRQDVAKLDAVLGRAPRAGTQPAQHAADRAEARRRGQGTRADRSRPDRPRSGRPARSAAAEGAVAARGRAARDRQPAHEAPRGRERHRERWSAPQHHARVHPRPGRALARRARPAAPPAAGGAAGGRAGGAAPDRRSRRRPTPARNGVAGRRLSLGTPTHDRRSPDPDPDPDRLI